MKRLASVVDKYGFVIHPILFAIFPLLSFYSANAGELQSGDFELLTFVAFNMIVAATAWVVSWVVMRNARKASLLTVVFLLLFFFFGRTHRQIEDFVINTSVMQIGPVKILVAVSLVILALGWVLLKRLKPETVDSFNKTLTYVGLALTISALVPILSTSALNSGSTSTEQQNLDKTADVSRSSSQSLPNIYYIVLDGYARADHLKDNFDHDNSEFLSELRNRGFYVAEQSNANYTHTHWSVPSTFNMQYLNYLAEEMGEESTDRKPLRKLTEQNEVTKILRSTGYKYITIGSQWDWATKSPLADIEVASKNNADSKILGIELDEFALVYLQTTALKPWISADIRNNLLAKILGAFERTEEVSKIEEPTFTFSHILSPHPPYLFDESGVIPGKTELELLNEGFSKRGKFKAQTIYVNKLTLDMVDAIFSNSDQPPIIILASDHGPASNLGPSDFQETDPSEFNIEGIQERLGILNAYYFPDQEYEALYPDISPVNTFRVVLSQYFGHDLELLPDKSYFSDNKENEYRMFDVTELLNQ